MADIVGDDNLRLLWERLRESRGDATFLEFQNRDGAVTTHSYRAFDDEINCTANLFLSLGVQPGETVAVQMHTCPEFMLCLFGLAKIGAIAVPMNEQYLKPEAAFVLERTGATCAVVEAEFAGLYAELSQTGDYLPKGLLIARASRGKADWPAAARRAHEQGGAVRCFDAERAAQPAVLREERPLSSNDPAEIIFTSGTTADPKGVVLTHANLLYSGLYGCWETSLASRDRLLTTMPACHSNFQLAALTPVLVAGATLIVVEKYSASRFWQQVRDYRATVAQCVAMMLRTMMVQPVQPGEQDHCLREMLYFLSVTDEEKEAFERRFNVRLMNTYGSTETVCWVLTDPPVGPRRWPSIGRPGLGYEVRIMADDGREAAVGEAGEIQVKGVPGRTIMAEYYHDPEATARTFTEDGWLRTGDRGYRDIDGWFFFVDRKANMIKRAGENISTTEIENVLVEHPAIEEAAVIGVDDPVRDQAVKAFVLPAEGASLDAEEVRAWCAERLAAFKVPEFVEFVATFPRTCSLKIEKKLLR
ncbi:crotonobetaine/carnitine-CoA ligase [uncultured Adlercreutzia sp.]|uniref:crotonobetaine/carnitine-CoA ligase n=1 Tax=uncultured Adlercreutzia sp. TaxID=875803 RepID=UPI00272E9732|nr:crotonobetaine/carnitine-CoA ligase [uncultured Adlercreutzia sp.]MCI9262828.1 crotonobetaine/carnitine-CoA ligase [Eggerthellaceae bacterium]